MSSLHLYINFVYFYNQKLHCTDINTNNIIKVYTFKIQRFYACIYILYFI